MSDTIIVHKGRTNVLTASLGIDLVGDVITSEIRTTGGDLIATWLVTFFTDGSDGELVMTLDNLVTAAITHTTGLMDMKRVTGGEPVNVFDGLLEVEFREIVTV